MTTTSEPYGVSFVATVYNKAPYLDGVIDALLKQQGDFAREFIFIDDGSNDASIEVIERRRAEFPAPLHIESGPNRGAGVAANRGVKRAIYRYVKLVDADDLILPQATNTLLEASERFGAVAAYGWRRFYDNHAGLPDEMQAPQNVRLPLRLHARPLQDVVRTIIANPSALMVRRQDWLAVGGAATDHNCIEVRPLMRLAPRGPFVEARGYVAFLPEHVPGRLGAVRTRELLCHERETLGLLTEVDVPSAIVSQALYYSLRRFAKWCRRSDVMLPAAHRAALLRRKFFLPLGRRDIPLLEGMISVYAAYLAAAASR